MATHRSADEWRELIEEQETSGLSIRGYAEEQGISARSLYRWRWALGYSARSQASSRTPSRRRTERRESDPMLVPVDVLGPTGASSAPARTIEVRIDDTVELRVPTDFEVARLADLVRALRSRC